jgi:hypothetical protein
VTVSDIAEAAETSALHAPKYTTSLLVVALKFVPAMVTVVPIGPDAGENDVIVGGGGGSPTTILYHTPISRRRQNIRKVFIVYPLCLFKIIYRFVCLIEKKNFHHRKNCESGGIKNFTSTTCLTPRFG